MRKWIKTGIISTVIIVLLSFSLLMISKVYFNSFNNTNLPSEPKPPSQNEVIKPNEPELDKHPTNEGEKEEDDKENNNTIKPNPDLPNIDEKPPKPEQKPDKPDHEIKPYPPENQKPDTTPPTLPEKPNKPDPIPPTNKPDDSNDSSNNKPTITETQYSIIKNFNKYEFVQKTTNYVKFFEDRKNLLFDVNKIQNNTYTIFKNAIIKSMNLDLNKNEIGIKVYYQVTSISAVKFLIKWNIKSTNNLVNIEKKYYDNIHINLKRII